MLTLRDLLEPRSLTLTVGDGEDYERPVRGIHCTDSPHPGDWIGEDWIVLTNGGGVRREASLQRELAADLADAGVAALGFGIGVHCKAVPRALLKEARALGLPVFEVPLEVSFVDMTRDVYEATLNENGREFIHLLAIQQHLIDALADDDAAQLILDRLAKHIDAGVAVVGPGGRLLGASGPVSVDVAWRELRDKRAMPLELEVDGHWAIAVPIGRSALGAGTWLVATRRSRFPDPRTMKRALQIAGHLRAALATLEDTATIQARNLRASLLQSIAEGVDSSTVGGLASRTAAFGIRFAAPARAVVVRDCSTESAERTGAVADQEAERVGMLLETREVPFLCAPLGDEVGVLLEAPAPELDSLVSEILDVVGPGAVAGEGREVRDVAQVPRSLEDARSAVARLTFDDDGRQLLRYEEFELDLVLLSEVARDRIEPQVRRVLAPIDGRNHLREALDAYFEHDLDVPSAAGALHLHPNTLRYRLQRVETLIGRPLRSPATITMLQLARQAGGPFER